MTEDQMREALSKQQAQITKLIQALRVVKMSRGFFLWFKKDLCNVADEALAEYEKDKA